MRTHRAEDDEDSPHDLEALRVAEDEQMTHCPGKRHHAVRQGVLVDVVGVMPESKKKVHVRGLYDNLVFLGGILAHTGNRIQSLSMSIFDTGQYSSYI